jgi:16S rRNA A1518/A1519 N6-dimethyltransferase RsmA/KsgA/DIM1 with predicted DNA glycosylase/AP lyase activity
MGGQSIHKNTSDGVPEAMDAASAPPASPGVRELLDKYNLRPRKRLGQNFLADPNILRKIVEAADLTPDAIVLEIGPGLGMLTRFLSQAAGRVVAVELDEALFGLLRQELSGLPNLELVQGDILQLDLAELVEGQTSPAGAAQPGRANVKRPRPAPACRPARPGLRQRARGQAGASQGGQTSNVPGPPRPVGQDKLARARAGKRQASNLQPPTSNFQPPASNFQSPPYTVVANLPYYITSAAIRHVQEANPPPQRIVLTVQREVAERIVAAPGELSLLAVSVQFYGRPRIVARIPAGAFVPPPKVDSAVVRIDTHPAPPVEVADVKAFFRVVRAGFGQKRKQIKNSLAAGLGLPGGEAAAVLARAGIDPQRRAQTLSLAEWAGLTREIYE